MEREAVLLSISFIVYCISMFECLFWNNRLFGNTLYHKYIYMEFDDLGKHCSYCQQKDILPMQCGCCNQYFCLEHIQRESHKCSMASINNNTVVVCKACDQTIRLVPGVSPKILVW